MDFFNRAYGQAVELFRSMSPGARITTGLLFLLVLTSLVFLFRQRTDGTNEFLFGGEILTQSDIAALEMAFAKAGLNGWTNEGNRIRVARSQKHTYLAAAAKENALPESFRNSSDEMLSQNSPFDSRDVRALRERNAREKVLVQTLRKMPDIEDAHVTLDDSVMEGFPPRKRRRVMVGVKAYGSKLLGDELVKTIRYTISAGANVDATDVTVTDLNGGLVYPGVGKTGLPTEFENLPAAYQRQYEGHYKQLIADALSMIPGVTVAVHVELDKEMNNETRSVKYDDKPTGIETNSETKELSSTTDRTAGRPGAVPNAVAPNQPAQIASAGGESTATENRENQKSVVGATETRTQKAGLSPTLVTATIGIPKKYFAQIWRQQNPAAKGDPEKDPPNDELTTIETKTIDEIQKSVANLLPRSTKGDSTLQLVKVLTYTEIPQAAPAVPSTADYATGWLADNWETLGLFVLAAFGVLFLRGMIRSAQSSAASVAVAPTREHAAPVDGATPLEETDEHEVSEVTSALKRKFQASGRSLRDELSDLVKGDPDAAANIVKLWISDAA